MLYDKAQTVSVKKTKQCQLFFYNTGKNITTTLIYFIITRE